MRRNRKLSRKKIILGSIAAVLVVATACGVVVAMHRKTPNSGTGQSITLEQSDYEEKKNDAIQQIQNTVKTLSENQQQKVSAYVEQNIQNIQKAETERTIEATLQETLDYLESVSLGENEEKHKILLNLPIIQNLLPVLLVKQQRKKNIASWVKITLMTMTIIFRSLTRATGRPCQMTKEKNG